MDGQKEHHDFSVCKEGGYELAVEGIKEAVKRGFRVTTNATLFDGAEPQSVRDFFDELLELGVEGMMLMGAMGGFAIWFNSGSLTLGLIVGMILGGLLALLHAVITISLRADQVVSGLAVTFLGAGLSSILGGPYVGKRVPVAVTFTAPVLGNVAVEQLLIIALGLIFAVLAWYYVNHTRPGLNLRAVGEYPTAADALAHAVTD